MASPAQIHGFDDSGAVHALVMELVEGRTLADLMFDRTTTPDSPPGIPVADAIRIARQIAEALRAGRIAALDVNWTSGTRH